MHTSLFPPVPVIVERTTPTAQLPTQATTDSAAYDLYADLTGRAVEIFRADPGDAVVAERLVNLTASDTLVLRPGDRAKIPTGLKMQPAPGFMLELASRSGHGWKAGATLANSIGVGDRGYPDEYFVLLINHGRQPLTVEHGDRIAQVLIRPVYLAAWVEGPVIPISDRAGGLGHTGR